MATFIVCLQLLSCIGYGAIVLRLLKLDPAPGIGGRATWSFAVGFGTLGWLLFFVGILGLLTPLRLGLVLGVGALGLFYLVNPVVDHPGGTAPHLLSKIDGLILCVIIIALIFDLLEAMAPPADADTLAYHFALPKQFIEEHQIKFVPRAVDGAIPLLIQMTYIPVLALGGELSLTLWTALTGWAAAAMLYLFARRHLNVTWSLALALLFLTTPAILFGAGTGQVETRMALFITSAILSMLIGTQERNIRYIILAAILVGFVAASKFTGLVFAAAFLPVIVFRSKSFKTLLIFGAVAFLVGSQWYFWNWLHTGDPVFPLLYGALEYADASYWDDAHQAAYKIMFTTESVVPKNIAWLVAYPFFATIAAFDAFESTRTGLGPLPLIILPFALGAFWRFRGRIKHSEMLDVILIVLVSYILLFFFAPSQRIRHFLPIFPMFLIFMVVVAHRWAQPTGFISILAAALMITSIIQIAGHGINSLNYFRYTFSGETREQFLLRNVSGFAPVLWINKNLSNTDRIFLTTRQLIHLIDVPLFYGHATDDARIDLTDSAVDPGRYYRQLRNQNVTHLLVHVNSQIDENNIFGEGLWLKLMQFGCAEIVVEIKANTFRSRMFSSVISGKNQIQIVKLVHAACRL
jgi:hypothetical protein